MKLTQKQMQMAFDYWMSLSADDQNKKDPCSLIVVPQEGILVDGLLRNNTIPTLYSLHDTVTLFEVLKWASSQTKAAIDLADELQAQVNKLRYQASVYRNALYVRGFSNKDLNYMVGEGGG